MHDDGYDELRATLALVRLAWPQLVTMFGFLFVALLRYPTWFVVLSVLVVTLSISQVAMNVARNPARRFEFAAIDGLLVGSGWSASLLSMAWMHIERTLHLEPGALLSLTIRTTLASTSDLVPGSIVTQWISCSGALLTMLIWAFSGRYLD